MSFLETSLLKAFIKGVSSKPVVNYLKKRFFRLSFCGKHIQRVVLTMVSVSKKLKSKYGLLQYCFKDDVTLTAVYVKKAFEHEKDL